MTSLAATGQFETLAQSHRILAAAGQGDGTLGHVSLRDPGGRGFWLKRAEIGMDEVRGQSDFLLLGFDGTVLAGSGGQHSEWPLHAGPLLARPALICVVHTHAPDASLFSAAGVPLLPYTTDGGYFASHSVPVHHAPRAHIDDLATAAAMEAAMEGGPALLIRNHGLVTCGASIEAATLTALVLDNAAKAQLRAMALPGLLHPAPAHEMAGREALLRSETFICNSFAYYARRCPPL